MYNVPSDSTNFSLSCTLGRMFTRQNDIDFITSFLINLGFYIFGDVLFSVVVGYFADGIISSASIIGLKNFQKKITKFRIISVSNFYHQFEILCILTTET